MQQIQQQAKLNCCAKRRRHPPKWYSVALFFWVRPIYRQQRQRQRNAGSEERLLTACSWQAWKGSSTVEVAAAPIDQRWRRWCLQAVAALLSPSSPLTSNSMSLIFARMPILPYCLSCTPGTPELVWTAAGVPPRVPPPVLPGAGCQMAGSAPTICPCWICDWCWPVWRGATQRADAAVGRDAVQE